jgi:hypothetical protein
MKTRLCGLVAAAVVLCVGGAADAWSARGHRLITRLAIDALPADAPAYLREPLVLELISEQSNEPDKWRSTASATLSHENGPDHYLDVEDLEQFGLTLETMPPLRQEYFRVLAISKHLHPELVTQPYNAAEDADKTKEWPGFLAHAICEHYQKLRSSFNTLRVLEALGQPERAVQLELARRNVVVEMGLLAHFVGDAAQPLHTTRHHHGWVGSNPKGYTTDRGIHAYIDGGIVEMHGYTYESLKDSVNFTRTITGTDPWNEVLAHIRASFEQVEPLYVHKRDGTLEKDEGKAFIAARLCDGAGMLGALYRAAWEAAAPTDQQVASWVKYNPVDGAGTPNGPRPGAGDAPKEGGAGDGVTRPVR